MRKQLGLIVIMAGSITGASLWVYWTYGCAIMFKMNYDSTGEFLVPALLSFVAFLINSFVAWLAGVLIMCIGLKIAGDE